MTDQPDTYVLDGVADREAKFQVVRGKIISSTVKDINENYALQYFYDELDRLLSIKSQSVDSLQSKRTTSMIIPGRFVMQRSMWQ